MQFFILRFCRQLAEKARMDFFNKLFFSYLLRQRAALTYASYFS